MSDPVFALQTAIHARLSGDSVLSGLLGSGTRIHDRAPRGAATPFVALGDGRLARIAADGGPIHTHTLVIRVVSRLDGRREAAAIADRIDALLDDAALMPAGHRLVSLRLIERVVSESRDRRFVDGQLRFRAVTEPL